MQNASSTQRTEWPRLTFVWGAWTLSLLAAVAYVVHYAHNVPYYDDWEMVEVLAGKKHADSSWLWQPRNEHRVPLPKLVLIALYTMSGWDFRVGMYFNVVILATLAAAALITAARLRGSVSYSDAFFPLLLLSWGHYENLLWSWQVTQVIPIAIAIALLLVIVRWGAQPAPGTALFSAAAVAALPLCGIAGLVFVPGFVLWLVAIGRNRSTSPARKARAEALAIWTLCATAAALIPLYFIGLHTKARATLDPRAVLQTSAAFLAQGFGAAAVKFRSLAGVFVLVMIVVTALVLVRALRTADEVRRSRARCLLFYLVAFGGMLLSVGIGRRSTVFPNRYTLFAVPALCWIYLTWDAFSRPGVARAVRGVLFLIVLSLAGLNIKLGREYAGPRARALISMEADIRAGQPPSQIIAAHQRAFLPFPEDGGAYLHQHLEILLAALHTKQVGAFAELRPETSFREVALATVATAHADSAGNLNEIWTFRGETFVHGVRLLRPPGLVPADSTRRPTTIYWRRDERSFLKARRGMHWWAPADSSATFWIYSRVAELGVRAESGVPPSIMLLVRVGDPTSAPGDSSSRR